jgi:dihydrofolate reductase
LVVVTYAIDVGKLIYSMSVSADGFIEGPDGDFSWGAPDEELFRFHTDRVRGLGAHLCGRRLYETMLYWEPGDRDSAFDADERQFAEIWRALPKVVFSTTLESVEGNARLARDSVPEEIRRLKEEVDGDLEVGGATLAAQCIELDLVDEYHLFVHPVIVGGGKPFFPPTPASLELELVETRSFASRVVHLRYRRPDRS